MKELLIYHHLGLGDHLICNAIVRNYAALDRYDLISVFCKEHNVPSVECMYSDLVEVNVVPVKDDAHAEQIIADKSVGKDAAHGLRLGATGPGGFDSKQFDREFYRQAGVPFEERWTKFRWGNCDYVEPPPRPYAFVHDDPERGFKIDYSRIAHWIPIIVRPNRVLGGNNIFNWARVIEEAKEVHCIPSSFSVLADSLPLVHVPQLFLHAYARPSGELPHYKQPWKLLQ